MKRGPKSSAELALIVNGTFGERPDPLEGLNERQAKVWRDTVASEPADYFNTAVLKSLLADYCRYKVSAADITSIIDTFEPAWLKSAEGARRFHSLLKMRDLENRAAVSMATKLRLTNQSRYTPQAASTASKNAAKGFKPWDL